MNNQTFSIPRLAILYGLLSLAYTLSSGYAPYFLSPVVKSLPILLLMFYVWLNFTSRIKSLLLIALGCSALGDVFLATEFEHNFIAGLGAFLAAHLFYFLVFFPLMNTTNKPFKVALCGLMMSYCVLLGIQVLPDDTRLKTAVVIYMLVLSTMCCGAIFAAIRGIRLHVMGAMVFALSDSMIAWDAFRQPIPHASYWIMTSYYLAQAMIVFGIFQLCGYGSRSPRDVTYN